MKISLSMFIKHIFQNCGVNETALSDFHKLVWKMFYTKQKPNIIKYRGVAWLSG